MNDLNERRNIVLGITGSIAAFKSAELARQFISRGYSVRVIMTEAAQEFITPLTMESVTGSPVVTDFWKSSERETIEHIQIADWADIIVIAPGTADVIAKLASGFADSPLLATVLASKAPVLIAPAMNVNMFEHPTTQENIRKLKERGVHFIDPETGALACGWNGAGRLADPWQIFWRTRKELSVQDYSGKKLLITTGPTREALDPVRFLSNRSSGKMGVALAREAYRRGAEVTLIHGPVFVKVPTGVKLVPVETAAQMHEAVMTHAYPKKGAPDLIAMVAAVADYRPEQVSETKLKKTQASMSVKLTKNKDILFDLGQKKGEADKPYLVGFAVETGELEQLIEEARSKLNTKNADMIVGNFATDAFDLDTNRVWIVDRAGRQEEVATTFKNRVANKVLDSALKSL